YSVSASARRDSLSLHDALPIWQRKRETEGILPPSGGDGKIVDPDGGESGPGVTGGGIEPDPDPVTVIDPPPVKKLRRFHGTVEEIGRAHVELQSRENLVCRLLL